MASKSQNNLRRAPKIANNSFYRNLKQNLGDIGFIFFTQKRNSLKHNWGHRCTTEDKIFALYKRGARSYRFLQRIFILSSKFTIQETLSKFISDIGINDDMLDKLEISIQNLKSIDRLCSSIFDEISLRLRFGSAIKESNWICGLLYIWDLQSLGRKNIWANHALVFMVNGLHKIWKQPIANYFTKFY